MDRETALEGNRADPLDLAGLVFIALLTLTCAFSALVGSTLAGRALTFLVGVLVGDGMLYLAIRSIRYRKPLAISALASVAVGLVVSFNLWLPGSWDGT